MNRTFVLLLSTFLVVLSHYPTLGMESFSDILNPGPMSVDLSPEDIQSAVQEAVEVVRQQIEVVEPHVFSNGKS